MLWYLNDLTEDATDFLWGSAEAAHALPSAKWRGAQCVDWIPVGSFGSGRHMDRNIVTLESKIGAGKNRMLKSNCIANHIK